ncbi:NUDIX hydrolase [Pseudalkalibacillus caeni]|uniref:NUDIX domain-containing protein n=1 Tax=Exobacillus caeni TaxID=2574798 RepID=A0A5R9F7L1_9BACL|nr:NUDIX domain-containing protein [Pseudalkalibacillus caeni]TLS38316.1 NUDIX domain-containing protein [Pseudalkalibacillus caeni]
MAKEMLDVFDENFNKIGMETREVVHEKGLWHQTFHCWVINKTPGVRLLFQKRHQKKDLFPSLLDISAAGHLIAGEEVEDGVREVKEELGLSLQFDDLHSVGVLEDVLEEDGKVDKEFCHVFYYETGQPLTGYHVQTEEVTGLFWIGLNDFMALTAGKKERITAAGFELGENGEKEIKTIEVSIEDFVPHHPVYLEEIFKIFADISDEKVV